LLIVLLEHWSLVPVVAAALVMPRNPAVVRVARVVEVVVADTIIRFMHQLMDSINRPQAIMPVPEQTIPAAAAAVPVTTATIHTE
jgi:hypothetical protein